MREVIQKVIQAEAEAQRMVDAAKEEADRMVADARRQAQELVASARLASRAAAEKTLQEAGQAALQEKKEQLDEAAKAMDKEVRLDPGVLKAAVDVVVRSICGGG